MTGMRRRVGKTVWPMSRSRSRGTSSISCEYLKEPTLLFAEGREHVDPKLGISRFGPKSFKPTIRHPSSVRVGFIGSAETIEIARRWIEDSADRVAGDEKHPEFPGFKKDRGFFSDLLFDDAWVGQLNRAEIDEILGIRLTRERFEALLQLLEDKLSLLASKDLPPEYVVITLPSDVYKRCRVTDYRDQHLGEVHRDLRRAFKSVAMKYRIPTQFLRQETAEGRDKDHPSKIAWNFFTGLYFKAGGFPWGPVGLLPGTCHMGVGFYRPLGSTRTTMQTSLAQAFDEHGEGLVLRGFDFNWDPDKEGSKSPHLTEEQAFNLTKLILTRYKAEMGQTPQRVVVHKTSRYWPAEELGFQEALRDTVSRYDLMALAPQSKARLLATSKYPPLRGTRFAVGETDYLYTTGFIAELGQFHGTHVPSPLQVADHVGHDTPRDTLLREILALTKMNFNSSRLGGLLPITLKFSQLVADIMREIPPDREPLANFKFYM